MSSSPHKADFLTSSYLPQAEWTVGGAFRFDSSLQTLIGFLKNQVGAYRITQAAGAPPCLWSLDYFVQRRPLHYRDYCQALENYAALGVGVTLVFDNPFLEDDVLEDGYGMLLVQELYKRDRLRRNAVCVASDKLAAKIRSFCPQLPLHCHFNRLAAESKPRTPELYRALAAQYDSVCLHPADGGNAELIRALTETGDPRRWAVVVNDPTLREAPMRSDHLQLLAHMRRAPYNAMLMGLRAGLIDHEGEQNPAKLLAEGKSTCNLTRGETKALYAAGVRCFILQSQLFRNEMTLLWDILHSIPDNDPAISNKRALVAGSAMAEFGQPGSDLPSGLKHFSFSDYE